MPNLRISLVQERPNQPFSPGSSIAGNVLLDVSKPKSYKQILLQFTGRSYVSWKQRETETYYESGRRHERTVTREYTSTEEYVKKELVLWNSQRSQDGNLAPGPHSLPFRFDIPRSVPSSFEGRDGNIRYTLMTKAITGLLSFNKSAEITVPIQEMVDVSIPSLLQPARDELRKTVCCLCCASQPIVLTIALPKTGFLLGESLQLHTSIENGSNRNVTITASIIQQITYYAQGNQRSSSIQLVVRSFQIEQRATQNWDPAIEIPTAGVDIITSCGNIAVKHILKITCKILFARKLSKEYYLVFGTYGREEVQSVFQQGSPESAAIPQPTAPPLMSVCYPQPPPGVTRDEPPPYSQAVKS